MYKSNFGKQMRAVMQNRTMAKYMGINSRKVDNITFAIGSVIIGSASIFTENYTSSTIAKAIVLLIVIIFLQKRPQGLFVIKSRNLDE